MLVESGHSVDIACNMTQELSPELLELVSITYDIPFNRSPLKRRNIEAYQNLNAISKEASYDIVHTHTPVASAIARMIFKKSNSRVIYTAHGFHFYKGAPLINWMLYYPIEWWLSKHTDVLITINKEDFKLARNKFNCKDVRYIPGVGINLNMFDSINNGREQKKKEIGIPVDDKLILSVGELNENKNHEVVIKALSILDKPNIHYVICGEGPLHSRLSRLISEYGLANQVHLLGFRHDVKEIYLISDLFIFSSKREGLPVAFLEALLAGLPVIASNIRGNTDLANLKLPIKLIDTLTPIVLADEIKLWLNAANISKNYSNIKEALSSFGSHNIEKQLIKIYFASD
jgi:glycosyltransferase involved in cell wall biosynthesis